MSVFGYQGKANIIPVHIWSILKTNDIHIHIRQNIWTRMIFVFCLENTVRSTLLGLSQPLISAATQPSVVRPSNIEHELSREVPLRAAWWLIRSIYEYILPPITVELPDTRHPPCWHQPSKGESQWCFFPPPIFTLSVVREEKGWNKDWVVKQTALLASSTRKSTRTSTNKGKRQEMGRSEGNQHHR